MFIGGIETVDYDIDEEMLFELVETADGFKPFIKPQQWSTTQDSWMETGYDEGTEPMPITMLHTEVFKQHLSDINGNKKDSLDYLSQAVSTMQELISKSS